MLNGGSSSKQLKGNKAPEIELMNNKVCYAFKQSRKDKEIKSVEASFTVVTRR